MAGPVANLPQHIQANAPGAAMLGSNVRVKGQPGFLGLQTDALMFSSGATGNWIAPNTRTLVQGVFTVGATSQGLAVQPGPPSPPIPVLQTSGDPRIQSQ